MIEWLQVFLDRFQTGGFQPLAQTGTAGLPAAESLQFAGDAALGAALLVLPLLLIYVQMRRRDRELRGLGWLAVALAVSLGLVHLLAACALWWPAPRLLAACKLAAALLSWGVVALLVPALPRILGLRSNEQLQQVDSRRRQAESALRTQESAYNSLIEALPLAVFHKDREGRYVLANQRCCHGMGRTLDELVGATDFELYSRDLAEKYRADDSWVMQSDQIWEAVEEHENAAGEKSYIHVLKAPVRDAEGRVNGIQGMFWDVTTREQAQAARRQSDLRFRRLVESGLFGVMLAGLDGRVIEANDALLEIVGSNREELEQQKLRWDRITPPEYRHLDEHALRELRTRGKCAPWEKEYVRQDGRRVPVLVGVTMVPGSVEECMCFVLDMTRQKQVERELREAKEAADAASRAKSQFLANMSHEIRSPMNAVIGLTELLAHTKLSEQQREYVALVLDSAESLLSIINDVLDFSKVEAGKMDLRCEPFSLRECLEASVGPLAVKAHGKGLELALDIPGDLPDDFLGDPLRLRQVVVNLVSNAVKFTDAGEVLIRAELWKGERAGPPGSESGPLEEREEAGRGAVPHGSEPAGDASQRPAVPPAAGTEVWGEAESHGDGEFVTLHLRVQDTGAGVPADRLESIFEAFEQVDGSMTRRHGGTGLGLAISRRLVQLMRGRIWAESELGRGSTFHFTVRLRRDPDPVGRPALAPVPLADVRVLIVDDNATNRRILHDMLEQFGMRSEGAEGGQMALERLRDACRDGHPYQLVLTDANMPDLDGLELAAAIQRDPEMSETPVMLLTSGDLPHRDVHQPHPAIAIRLSKPLKQAELRSALRTIVRPAGSGDSTSPAATAVSRADAARQPEPAAGTPAVEGIAEPGAAAGDRRLRILLAEDSPVNQHLACGLLTGMGHEVVVAANGREALEALDSQEFDLVLMDVQMPEMDGLTAVREIRRRERGTGRRLPIVALTAHAMQGDRQRCLDAGMDDYLSKPVRPGTLRDSLWRHARRGNAERPGEAERPGTARSEAVRPDDDWDLREILENFGGDEQLMRQVACTFLAEIPGTLEAFRSACQRRDSQGVRQAAHKLKGSVRYFTARRAFDVVEALEHAIKVGDMESAPELWEALEREIDQLQRRLEHEILPRGD